MRDVQKVMAALGSPVRRDILALVWDRELSAGAIADAFDLTKPTISQHLAVLRDAGLVTQAAVGTSRFYRARPEALVGLRGAFSASTKWLSADDVPEQSLSEAYTKPVVVASVDVPTDQESTFKAFIDGHVYSRWLGVPVSIVDGVFACTMEWGTQVRGRYDVICSPEFIALRWDFEDDNVPVPGGEMTGYLRITPRGSGAHVEVHQIVDTDVQAEFMEAAWSGVLGRLSSGVVAALDPGAPSARRPARAKHRDPA